MRRPFNVMKSREAFIIIRSGVAGAELVVVVPTTRCGAAEGGGGSPSFAGSGGVCRPSNVVLLLTTAIKNSASDANRNQESCERLFWCLSSCRIILCSHYDSDSWFGRHDDGIDGSPCLPACLSLQWQRSVSSCFRTIEVWILYS